MGIEEIEKRIIREAEKEAAKIREEADEKLRQIEKVHTGKKEEVKTEFLEQAERKAEETRRFYLIPARLAAQKALLEEKQKILSGIYSRIQKEKNLSAAEISRLREETEVKAARILFGEHQ